MRCRAACSCSLLLLTFAMGCRGGGRDINTSPEPDAAAGETPKQPVEVFIRSFNLQPVRVHVIHGGDPVRLGVVADAGGDTFVLPRELYASGTPIHFVLTRVGDGERFVSAGLILQAGNHVEWTIAERIEYSTVVVW